MNIAVFTKNRINPAYGAARLGAERVAAQLGARARHYVPEQADDAIEQCALLERALASRPDAVVLAPVHPTRLNAVLDRIIAAGIPVVGMISRVEGAQWAAFVGSDDYQLGVDLATHLFRHLSGKGDVIIVEGSADSSTSVDRVRGFHAAAARYTGIHIVGTCAGGYQFEPARQELARLLPRIARADAVLAANDVMALGAIAALRDAGRQAQVVGVNAIPQAIDAIKDGSLFATADFSAMNLGAVATECAIRHLRGEPVPREIVLPVQIVDRANIGAWDMPYEARPCIDWAEAIRGQA